MKRFGLAFCVSFVVFFTVFHARASDCKEFDIKNFKGLELSDATPEQYRYFQGIYAAWPTTEPGLPPGDGATVAYKEGEKMALLVFTRDHKLVCTMLEVPVELVNLSTKLGGDPL